MTVRIKTDILAAVCALWVTPAPHS